MQLLEGRASYVMDGGGWRLLYKEEHSYKKHTKKHVLFYNRY
jgi:hypothetical protein